MTQPDIHYFPDIDKYRARTKRRLETEEIDSSLPDGFPVQLESTLAWDGSNPNDSVHVDMSWIHVLTEPELEEIDAALKAFLDLNLGLGHLSPETFPLPNVRKILRRISHDVHEVRGFAVLRGIPVDKYTRHENVVIYGGMNSHVGIQRGRQDHHFLGNPADVVISHIRDLRSGHSRSIGSPAYTNDAQAYHNDSGDLISLFMLDTSAEGGESEIASSWRVYNELAKHRPDLIRTMAEDWTVDRRKPATPYINRPVLYHQPPADGKPERIILQCSRGSFTDFGALPRSSNIPPITEAQAEALDALHFLAKRFCISIKLVKGDIQYLHDFSMIHARAAFEDSAEHQRHLLRMWFRDPENAWPTPTQLLTRWHGVYGDVHPENQVFPEKPYVRTPMNATQLKLDSPGSVRA